MMVYPRGTSLLLFRDVNVLFELAVVFVNDISFVFLDFFSCTVIFTTHIAAAASLCKLYTYNYIYIMMYVYVMMMMMFMLMMLMMVDEDDDDVKTDVGRRVKVSRVPVPPPPPFPVFDLSDCLCS